jgi:DNA-binding transcriptional LysR family regulator
MNFTLHQLQVFLKISKFQSITKAARDLNLSQPAVSIQLRNFQEHFEIPLTEVIGKKLHLTEFGKSIAVTAQKIINEVYEINYKSTEYMGMESGRLNIAIASTGKYLMPYFISDFVNKHRGIELYMDVNNRSEVINQLRDNVVDLVLVSQLPEDIELEYIPLVENKMFLFHNPNIIDVQDMSLAQILEVYPFIFREEGSATRIESDRFIDNMGLKVKRKIVLTSNEAVKQAVMAGLGVSILPIIGLKNQLKSSELKIIPTKGLPLKTEWVIAWHKTKALSPGSAAFIKHLSMYKEMIIQKHFDWM